MHRGPDLQQWQSGHQLEFLDGAGALIYLDDLTNACPQEYYVAPLRLPR